MAATPLNPKLPQTWLGQQLGVILNYLRPLGHTKATTKGMEDEQTRTLATTALLFSALGINSISLILLDFGFNVGLSGASLSFLIVVIYVGWALISFGPLRPTNRIFIRTSLLILLAQGVLWGCLVNKLALIANPDQRNIVTAIIMALVSVPMLGAPFAAAMAFWIPIVIASTVAVGLKLQPFDDYMFICFGGYLVFTLGGIIIINKTLLDRSIGRIRLLQQNEQIAVLLRDYEENTADWLWETDAELRLHGVSTRLAKLLFVPVGLLEGKIFNDVIGLPGNRYQTGQNLAGLLTARAAFRNFEIEIELQDGTHWCRLTGRPIIDSQGSFLGYRGFGSEVTEARLSERRIRHLATHDSLTELYNRSVFLDRLERACEGAQDGQPVTSKFALLLLDLDRFKEANDTYGHATGDALLVQVAERLRQAVRDCDIIARLGGDEFAIYLPSVNIGYASDIAKRLIALLSKTYQVDGAYVTIGASFGIAMFPEDGLTPQDLLRNVDLALYAAKEQERGSYQIFNARMSEVFFEQLALQSDLRLAMGTNQIYVDYQPIISLSTNKIVSVEALARWNHPTRGPISPAVFIPLAEEAGMISVIGEFVLREACRVAASWNDGVRVAVNLSPVQFGNPNLPKLVANVLAESGLNPTRLELEVTESTWLIASQQILSHIDELERTGVMMVLDDFGTGYSSLSCLREFCFQGVKIDKSFIRDMEHDAKAVAIVKTIVRLAAEISVPLTAEGVETRDQLMLLRDCGIDRVQGFYLGRPQASTKLFPVSDRQNEVSLAGP